MSRNEYLNQLQQYRSLKLMLLKDPLGLLGRHLTKKEIAFLSSDNRRFYRHLIQSKVVGAENRFEMPVSDSILKHLAIWDINRAANVFRRYKKVYIFANSETADPVQFTYTVDDLVMVFNKFNRQWLQVIPCDLCLVERQSAIYNSMLAHQDQQIYQRMAFNIVLSDILRHSFNLDPEKLSSSLACFSSDYINYSLDKSTVSSSGYMILYFLNHLRLNYHLEAEIIAVGFQFKGANVHDWQYESMMAKGFPFIYR